MCVFLINAFFVVGVFYSMLVAEKHTLLPLKEKFTMIQLYNKYLRELSFLKYPLNLNEHSVC